MNILQQSEADLSFTLEDDVSGFGRAVTLNDNATPTPHIYNVKGQVTRTGAGMDPGTGQQIPANTCAITVRLSSLGAGIMPAEGWSVSTTDITGAAVTGKVKNVMPDRTRGTVTFMVRA